MTRTKQALIVLGMVSATFLASCGPGGGAGRISEARLQSGIDKAINDIYPALVRIHVVVTAPSGGRILKFQASGSGAIITKEGHVITNHHVAGNATRIICRTSDREEIEADLVGTDPMTDIAVLKLRLDERKDPAKPIVVAEFGDSDKVRVGDTVLAMGSPAGLSQSVTAGVVSNTEMILPGGLELDGENVGVLVRWIGHDAHIYHGNSGGPLANLDGQIIGINEVGIAGIGGAIPANLARDVANQLIETGTVKRGWAGLTVQPLLPGSDNEKGALVSGVIGDSPADDAGIRAGDIVLTFDGEPITVRTPEELPLFYQRMLSTPPEKPVEIVVLRDGEKVTCTVTASIRQPAKGEDVELRDWGMTARDFTLMSAINAERDSLDGVIVHSLRPGSPCSDAKPKIRPGDIITEVGGKPVANVGELQEMTADIVEGQDEPVPTIVGFDRGSEKLLTVVRVGREPERDKPTRARKAWLAVGTQVLTRDLAEALGLEGTKGFRVTQVYEGYGPDKAGLKVGDLLVKLDGMVINASQPEDADVLTHLIRQYRVGSEVELGIIRGKKRDKVTVTLDRRPPSASEFRRYKDEDFEFAARNLSHEDIVSKKMEKDAVGVLVESVARAGWADLAGVRAGDVILTVDNKPVTDVGDLEKVLDAARKAQSRRVVFFVKRGIRTGFLVLEPDWTPETAAPDSQ